MKKIPFIPDSPHALMTVLSHWLPVLLLLLVAYQSAGLTWNMVSFFRVEPNLPPTTTSLVRTSTNQAGTTVIPDLSSLHLFGNAVEEVTGTTPIEAPKTSLNLTLHGVFVDQDPSQSGAIIGTSGGNQKYFKQGQVVDSSAGVTLSEVRPDQVILFRGGRYESLRFPKTSQSNSAVFKATGSQPVKSVNKISKRNIMENIGACSNSLGKRYFLYIAN